MSFPIVYIEELSQDDIDWRMFIRYLGNNKFAIYSTRRPIDKEDSKLPYLRYEIEGAVNVYHHINTLFERKCRVNTTMSMVERAKYYGETVNFETLDDYMLEFGRNYEMVGFDNEKLKYSRILSMLMSMSSMV